MLRIIFNTIVLIVVGIIIGYFGSERPRERYKIPDSCVLLIVEADKEANFTQLHFSCKQFFPNTNSFIR